MAKARTRTFRMRDIDDWALAQAREAMGGDADSTAALQLLLDLGIEVGVQRGYWAPYQAPSIEDRLGPERAAAARAALQGSGRERGVDVETQPKSAVRPIPQPDTEKRNETSNNGSPVSLTLEDGKPLPTGGDVELEDSVREVEEQPAQPVLFDDGPDLPEGWIPDDPSDYQFACKSCGIGELRWVGPREPKGLRRFQDRAGTIHNPGVCRRRQEAAKNG